MVFLPVVLACARIIEDATHCVQDRTECRSLWPARGSVPVGLLKRRCGLSCSSVLDQQSPQDLRTMPHLRRLRPELDQCLYELASSRVSCCVGRASMSRSSWSPVT